ncbi:hypothetical protein [Ostreibacterium oceani]|uniref:Lipoprotein n=1 Tax=Ostreibacterium oceani TaxID=2654998 RepID=A0A6N7EVD4_9GAMM|nr:hypothetical protein [Ostreibacterium oceani]MPV85923.1 hypothetical protein [Ostreibacterium oceani]
MGLKTKKTGIALAVTASMLIAGCASNQEQASAKGHGHGHGHSHGADNMGQCHGANSCKGKGSCGAAIADSCKGTDSCKAKKDNSCKGKAACKTKKDNSCKGKSGCKAKAEAHSCAGMNSCKGKGWLPMSQSDCDAKGGRFKGAK